MKKRLLPILIFIAYTIFLVVVMVFKSVPTVRVGHLMFNFRGTEAGHPANFIPFKTIIPYLLGYKGLIIAGINLIGNIVLLIPLGFLFPFAFRLLSSKRIVIAAIVIPILIETMQSILHVGIFDIDDVILNVLGFMIGYWIFMLLMKWIKARKYTQILIGIIVVLAIGIVLISTIHLQKEPTDHFENTQAGEDLCGGTGGTGQITSIDDHSITIKRHDGVIQTLTVSDQTMISDSAGRLSKSGLHVGDNVTVVTTTGETASVVLVCDTTGVKK